MPYRDNPTASKARRTAKNGNFMTNSKNVLTQLVYTFMYIRMSELKNVILGFSDMSQPADADLLPLLAHAYLENISAAKVHVYLTQNGVTVAARRIRDLRRQAGVWLGLGNPSKGRMSRGKKEELLQTWHQLHGYPTLADFVNGWSPALQAGDIGESKPVTNNDNSGLVEKKHPMQRPATTKTIQSARKSKGKFAELAKANPPLGDEKTEIPHSDFIKSIKSPLKEQIK